MEYKLFGLTFRLEVVIICMAVGAILGGHLLCSCSKIGLQEGMAIMGSTLDSQNNSDQSNSWINKGDNYADQMGYSETRNKWAQYKGTPVPLPEGQMFMFQDNEFKPDCCPSTYTNSVGCACMTQEQVQYINERGGNRTMVPSEY